MGIRLVKMSRCQIVFCQESLTKLIYLVDNRVTYSSFPTMGALNKLAGALALTGALTASADAQEAENVALPFASEVSAQVIDCVGFVREQRDLAADTGISLSRAEQKSLLHECRNGELTARIAEQERILDALDVAIMEINLRIDENARIIDENGQVIAHIITINGQWVIQRQLQEDIKASQARQQQMLDEAERILNGLVS